MFDKGWTSWGNQPCQPSQRVGFTHLQAKPRAALVHVNGGQEEQAMPTLRPHETTEHQHGSPSFTSPVRTKRGTQSHLRKCRGSAVKAVRVFFFVFSSWAGEGVTDSLKSSISPLIFVFCIPRHIHAHLRLVCGYVP